MKITTEFRNFPQLPEFPEEKQTTWEALLTFLSSNEGITIVTLTVTNCFFLTSTIFLALLRKSKQGGENEIELQQMAPIEEEIPLAPQEQQDPPAPLAVEPEIL